MRRLLLTCLLGLTLPVFADDALYSASASSFAAIETAALLTRAQEGDMLAQVELGLRYYQGWRVEIDHERALHWWRKALAQGSVVAAYNLGFWHENSDPPDLKQARDFYRLAAERDFAYAQTRLARFYETGRGGEKDFAAALHWYEKAAAKDEAEALHNLGVIFDKGESVAKDRAHALALWKRAAALNLAQSQYNLGVDLLEQANDPDAARLWWERAAAQGFAPAQYNLGIYYRERGEEEQARYWLEKAGAQGGKVP